MSSSERRLSGVLSKDAPSELTVDARVEVQGKPGTVRFVGTTSFQTGKWVGIELDTPNGKNSGVVQGKRYFECRTNHGVFVRPSQVKPLSAEVHFWLFFGKPVRIKIPRLNPFVNINRRIRNLLLRLNLEEDHLELVKRQMVFAQPLVKRHRHRQHYFHHVLGHLAVQPKRQLLHPRLHVELPSPLHAILHHQA
jgi:CAP-Gly domain